MKNVIYTWALPPGGVKERDEVEMEMKLLFDKLPQELSQHIFSMFNKDQLMQLCEIYLQLGQYPECIFSEDDGKKLRHRILDRPCTTAEIDIFAKFFEDDVSRGKDGRFVSKRKGISGTIHRVSLLTDPSCEPEKVIGITVRVGRAMEGLLQTMASGTKFFEPIIANRHSLLIIGRPGVGKSTALREIAYVLSQNQYLTVVLVDKSKELGGDGETPHPAIGNCRWMPVGKRNMQHEIMLEAVENQSPDVVIVDEISNKEEVRAAETIAQRGIMLIATVHGNTIPELISDQERGPLVGNCTSVTLSGREADKRSDKAKQVLKRKKEPVFQAALELHSRKTWIFHNNVKDCVDAYLDKEVCNAIRLNPGEAVGTTAIPAEGMFEYCDECTSEITCNKHFATAAPVHIENQSNPFSSRRGRKKKKNNAFK